MVKLGSNSFNFPDIFLLFLVGAIHFGVTGLVVEGEVILGRELVETSVALTSLPSVLTVHILCYTLVNSSFFAS